MRIALVTDAWYPQVNGVVTTLNKVKEHLERDGHEFLVIHPGLFKTIACPRYPEIKLSLLPGRGIRKLLAGFEPEAIHIATEGPIGLAARRHCAGRRIPFTTSFHTQFAQYLRMYFRVPERWTYAALRWFHRAACRTLVPTPSVQRQLQERGFGNVMLWTRGVDADLFKLRDKAFLAFERPIFLYAGRVAHEKNIEAFLSAALPGTKLVVGDGPATPSLRKRYPDVKFVGYKHGVELASHFAASDVFVFPSRTDTFGVVMLEAMASGLPVAAYPVTGPIDVVRDGETGVTDEDLAAAARKAVGLSPERCREHAMTFSWRRCADIFHGNLEPIKAAAPALAV